MGEPRFELATVRFQSHLAILSKRALTNCEKVLPRVGAREYRKWGEGEWRLFRKTELASLRKCRRVGVDGNRRQKN